MSRAMAFGSVLVSIVLLVAVVPSSARFSLFRSSTKVNQIFVFGDSTVDVGNNNNYTSDDSKKVIKANFKPYGIDYPKSQPTGRFSNGYNIIDNIASYLGFEESPLGYKTQPSQAINMNLWLKGANFASGGSGVFDSTESWLSMAEQIKLFKDYKAKVAPNIFTKFIANWRLRKSLFVISTGSNDVFNFYKKRRANSNNSPQDEDSFFKDLAGSYKSHVAELYKLGARKFAILNVGMIGCYPISRMIQLNMECNDELNELAHKANTAIAYSIKKLSQRLGSMKYSISSTYNLMSSLINWEDKFKPDHVAYACCTNKEQLCTKTSTVCEYRSTYLFWDMMHMTAIAASAAAHSFIKDIANQNAIILTISYIT